MTKNLNGTDGSVTIISAVSPQGSDFSEPVTQTPNVLPAVFWALDKALAYARHYPAINWTQSYSEYFGDLDQWYTDHVGEEFVKVPSTHLPYPPGGKSTDGDRQANWFRCFAGRSKTDY